MQPSDLEAIVKSWNPDKKLAPQDKLQADVLTLMFAITRDTRNTRMPIQALKARAGTKNILSTQVETALTGLRTKEYVMLTYDPKFRDACSFKANGYEVFVPERSTLLRFMYELYGLYETRGWPTVWLPRIAGEVGFGEYSITLYYLSKLRGQGVVFINTTLKEGKKLTETGLTDKGKELGNYLKRNYQR